MKEMFCTHDAPLSSPWADTGERAFNGRLKFQESVLNVESFALRLFGMLVAQGCCESRVFLKLMSCPGTGRGGPSQQERYPVNTANGVPGLLPYQPSVRRLAAMKIVETTSRAIGTKFLPREVPTCARRSQGSERRWEETAQGDEAARNFAVTGEGDADFKGIAPTPRFG